MNEAPSTRRAWSIQTKLLWGILPTGIGTLFFVVGLHYYQLKRFTQAELKNSMASLVNKLAENVERTLEERANELITLAQNPLFVDYHNNVEYNLFQEATVYKTALENFLVDFSNRSKTYPDIFYINVGGSEIFRIVEGAIIHSFKNKPSGPILSPAGKYLVSRHAMKGPADKPLLYFSKTVTNASGDPLGTLALGYSLEAFEKLLEASRMGTYGFAYIEDQEGNVMIGKKPPFPDAIESTSKLSDPPWQLHVAVAPNYFLEPLQKLRNWAIVVGLGTAIVTIGFIFFAVRSITRPVKDLLKGTRELAKGNLDVRVSVQNPSELGILANAFNEMAGKLKEREEEQRLLQQHLLRSEKLSVVGQLISGIAHELNNPLSGVTGYAELILEEECPAPLKADLKQIYTHATRCRKIVDNLLLFVRQEAHPKKPLSLNKVVRSVLLLLEYRLTKAENIRIKFMPSKIPPVEGDFQQLEQVVINLLQNACDALKHLPSEQQRQIAISTYEKDGQAQLTIEDNGIGISPDHLSKIFEPFFTTKEAGKGTGLGLAIVQQIINEHQGTLSCQSDLEKGTVFRVGLPFSTDKKQKGLKEILPSHTHHAKYDLLVIDDEKDIAQMIARLAEKYGHRADIAYNAKEALQRITNKNYALVLLDLEMPDMDGRDLYGMLLKINASMARKLIFMTGNILGSEAVEFFEKQKIPYIAKPFNGQELANLIARQTTHSSV